jgi:hypothetical protein
MSCPAEARPVIPPVSLVLRELQSAVLQLREGPPTRTGARGTCRALVPDRSVLRRRADPCSTAAGGAQGRLYLATALQCVGRTHVAGHCIHSGIDTNPVWLFQPCRADRNQSPSMAPRQRRRRRAAWRDSSKLCRWRPGLCSLLPWLGAVFFSGRSSGSSVRATFWAAARR